MDEQSRRNFPSGQLCRHTLRSLARSFFSRAGHYLWRASLRAPIPVVRAVRSAACDMVATT